MNKKTKIFLMLMPAFLLVLGFSCTFFNQPQDSTNFSNLETVNIIINFGDENNNYSATINIKGNESALNVIQKALSDTDKELKTSKYDIGVGIEAIGDYVSGETNKEWRIYLNENHLITDPENEEVKHGDIIELRFEAIDK